ncbi:hypothetical protein PFISCL1PPCAC_21649, partial [Pristionchus fissidentatus]
VLAVACFYRYLYTSTVLVDAQIAASLTAIARRIAFIIMCVIAQKQSLQPMQHMRHLRPFLPFINSDQEDAAEVKVTHLTSGTVFKLAKTVLLATTVICIAFAPLLSTIDKRAFFTVNAFASFNILFAVLVNSITSRGIRLNSTVTILAYTILLSICSMISYRSLDSTTNYRSHVFWSSLALYSLVIGYITILSVLENKKDSLKLNKMQPHDQLNKESREGFWKGIQKRLSSLGFKLKQKVEKLRLYNIIC